MSDLGETATANFTNSLIVVQSWLRYRDIGSLGSCRSTKDFHRSCAAFGKKSRKSSPLVSVKSVHIPSAPRSVVVNWRNHHQSPGSISSLWLADASHQHPLDQIGRGTTFRQSHAHCLTRFGSMLRPARRQVWQLGCASRSAQRQAEKGQLTPVEGASGAAVARRQECFLWQEWRLVEPFSGFGLFRPLGTTDHAAGRAATLTSVTECGPAEAAQITKWHQRSLPWVRRRRKKRRPRQTVHERSSTGRR